MTRPRLYADTHPEAEDVLFSLLRSAPPDRKWQMVAQLNRQMRDLLLTGLRHRHPQASEAELFRRLAALLLGDELAEKVYGPLSDNTREMDAGAMNEDAFCVTLRVIDALESLDVPYLLGGSLAAALYGVPRTTVDSDLVADLDMEKALRLAQMLRGEFYVSLDAIFEAIEQRSAFNLIHLATAFKVDIFIRKDRPFDRAQFARRIRRSLPDRSGRAIDVVGPEDLILAKLEWYRLGGETSERQWTDVAEIVRVQTGDLRARLDITYLRRAAVELGVADLLEKLLS